MADVNTNYKITATYQEALSAFERINAEIGEGATTIAGMTDKAAKLNKEFRQTKVGTEAFEFLGQQTKKANAELSAMIGTTARFNMVGMNTARLFSDMGYFANSASMGILSIGNNISPLVESFQQAKLSGQSFTEVLKGAFAGAGGWLIGINMLVSAITAYSIASSKASKQEKEQKTSIDSLTSSYKDFSDIIEKLQNDISNLSPEKLETTFNRLNQKMQDLNVSTNRWIDDLWEGLTFFAKYSDNPLLKEIGTTPILFGKPSKDKQAINETEAGINAIKKQYQTLKTILTEPIDFSGKSKNELKQYLALVTNELDDWGKKIKAKNLSPRDQLGRILFDVGTFDRARVEALQKKIEELYSPTKARTKKERDTSMDDEFGADRQKKADEYWDWYYDSLDKLEKQQAEDRKKYETEVADFRVGAIENVFRREEAGAMLKTERLIALDKERLDRDSINQEQHNAYVALLTQQLERQKSDIADKEQKKIQDDEEKRNNKITQSYNKIFNVASKTGALLERAFDKTGKGFISQLNEALQIVNQIADIMESVGLIKQIVGTAGSIATGNPAGIVASTFSPSRRENNNTPTIAVSLNLDGTIIGRAVAYGQQVAEERRY